MNEYPKSSVDMMKNLNEIVEKIIINKEVFDYQKYKNILENITPFDVFNILAFQEDSEFTTLEIKENAGKLVNLFRHGLQKYEWKREKISIMVGDLLAEGQAIREHFQQIKVILKQDGSLKKSLIIEKFKELSVIEKRFLKMQNIVYSQLEKYLINSRPLKIMWSLHDDALELLPLLIQKLENSATDISKELGKYFFLVLGIIEKEELLVLPIASLLIDSKTWDQMGVEALRYGYAFIEPNIIKEMGKSFDQKGLLFNNLNGSLNNEELFSIFNCLEIDLTFVDKDNKVKFFTNHNNHFPRSSSIIGRDVRNCHPLSSVHIVEEIIDKFRLGKEDKAQFWINFKSHFMVITYYAVRNIQGDYLGVLEVTQDGSSIRTMAGEKRLLDWNKK